MSRQKQVGERMIFYMSHGFGDLETGSRVRPYKMYQAFLNLGYEVDLIAGTPSERMEQYKKTVAHRKYHTFCYFEPNSYPVHPIVDYRILFDLWRRGVPVGIFYRDAYWKFSDYFPYRGKKRLELLLRYNTDLFLFSKVASALFFPTASLASLFKVKVPTVILPPGGEHKSVRRVLACPLRAIYVGEVGHRYGTDLMLKALQLVNQEKTHLVLDFVCRKSELEALPPETKKLLQVPWVNIHHISGDKLQSVYSNCHIGLIPRLKNAYNDLALPIKLFEYLSFGVAVVATACEETRNFIEANDCGLVCKDDAQSLANALRLLIDDPNLLRWLGDRARETILNGNLWEDRAKTAASVLKTSGVGKSGLRPRWHR